MPNFGDDDKKVGLGLPPEGAAAATPEAGPEKAPDLDASVSLNQSEGPKAKAADEDFLSMFSDMDEPSAKAVAMEPDYADEAPAAFANEGPTETPEVFEVEARAIRADREIRMALPVENPTQALSLAAMPHYELGGNAGTIVGHAEMRLLLSESEASVRGGLQNTVKWEEAPKTLDFSNSSPEVQRAHQRAVEVIRVETALNAATQAALKAGVDSPIAYRFAAVVTSGASVDSLEVPEVIRSLEREHPREMTKTFEEGVADLQSLAQDFRNRLTVTEEAPKIRTAILAPSEMADRNIAALLKGGYIETVKPTPEQRTAMMQVNDFLKDAAPQGWNVTAGVDAGTAYRLTDKGITAGREIRSWDGDTPEAGLVRLPGGEPMPLEVAEHAYAISEMMMQDRANAGLLKPGELGAFLRAELNSIEYASTQGRRPATTLAGVEAVLDGAFDSVIQQNEMGVAMDKAPLSFADMKNLSERARALAATLPDIQEVSDDPENPDARWLEKERVEVMAARLDGARIGTELVHYDIEKALEGLDMTKAESWQGLKKDTPDLQATLVTMKLWLNEVAMAPKKELAAMAEGVFGRQGSMALNPSLEHYAQPA